MRAEVLLAFLAMAAVSYGIRVAGFLVGQRLHEHPRLSAALDQLPAAILIALVVPLLARGGFTDFLLIPLAAGVVAVVLLRGVL
jgi:uncharacterized membrane protein